MTPRRDPLSPSPNGMTCLTPAEQAAACAALCELRAADATKPKVSAKDRARYITSARRHGERCAQLRPLLGGDDDAIASALERCGYAVNAIDRHLAATTANHIADANNKVNP